MVLLEFISSARILRTIFLILTVGAVVETIAHVRSFDAPFRIALELIARARHFGRNESWRWYRCIGGI